MATETETLSFEEHIKQLSTQMKLGALNTDSAYYESERRLEAIGVSTPPQMRKLVAQVGWPRTYVDSIEERLDVEGFRLAGQSMSDPRLWDWWQSNQLDVESGLGHTESLVHGSCYVSIAAPDPEDPLANPDVPSIRVESPRNMVAEINPLTRRVNRAMRLEGKAATLFFPTETIVLERKKKGGGSGWSIVQRIVHNLGVVPVVPIVNRARLTERLGRSEIVPELRSITDAAARTMMNMQATAELMAVPQRLLFGVARDALQANPDDPSSVLDAYLAKIIAIEDTDAHATQFSAAELRNFVEVLQELSKQAASYTGLPPQYLSFSTENPASAEAIRSAESRLVKKCERKARIFGESWEQVMRIAMLIMDGQVPKEAHKMESVWADPSTPTFAAKADAVVKLASTQMPDGRTLLPLEQARMELGYSDTVRRNMKQMDKETPVSQLSSLLGPGVPGKIPAPQEGDDAA